MKSFTSKILSLINKHGAFSSRKQVFVKTFYADNIYLIGKWCSNLRQHIRKKRMLNNLFEKRDKTGSSDRISTSGRLSSSRTHENTKIIFTARCYASAVQAMGLCLSVCLSVCLSRVGVLLKRLNVGSHKWHHTIAQGLQFSDAKDLR